MYNLGEQFVFDHSRSKANEKNIVQGEKYRFTILSERLIRLEYSEDGIFEDRPTQLVWYRDMQPVKYEKKEDERFLQIKTKYFELKYVKNKDFSGTKINQMANLRVTLLNTDRIWYYNHPEVRNYGAPIFSLDNDKGEVKLSKGLYSVDGFVSLDDSKSDIFTSFGTIEKRDHNCKDIYLFMYLKDFTFCLKDYFMITGYPSLIPRYALGNWWSKNITYSEDSIKQTIQQFELNNIPLSIFLLDKKWHVGEKNGFSFNSELFKEPNSLIDYLHSKNIKLGLNINPLYGISSYEQNFSILSNHLQPDANGNIPFDVLDPKTIDAYLKILIHPLEQQGVDFFWTDIDDKRKIKELFILNHYHFLDVNVNRNKRSLLLSRNTNIAPHRYPVLYSGKTIVSWETLKNIPYYNGCAANLGISFIAHDVGGYYLGTEDNELYTRYVQLLTFSPILKFGSEDGKYYKREPWKLGIKTYNITKKYLNLRHHLIPYIYSEAYKYSKYGSPLILPIYYTVPKIYDDLNYRNEYFFGSQFFICPITTKKDYLLNRVIHKFYLPEGTWYDFSSGKKFIGGRKHLSFFKDEDYPAFVKSGAIVPLSNNEILNSTDIPEKMDIQFFPGKSNQYKLYEDDGITELYKLGNYLLTSIEYNYLPNNYTVIIRPLEGRKNIIPDFRDYRLIFRNTKESNEVIAYLNDSKIEEEHYVKGNDFIVEIKHVSTVGQLTINCKGKNIEIDSLRIINDDIESIISDLQIPTTLKEEIDSVLFGNDSIKKKRIEIRKLINKGLDKNLIKLFLKLLEYIDQVYR